MTINTSKTYDFNPSLGEMVLEAFSRIGVRPSEVTQQHIQNARVSANLVLAEWGNLEPNLWEVGLQTSPLIQGTETYSVDSQTVTILDLYITTSISGTPNDRYISPISRTEYASYPNKTQQGFPTVFWFDRLISPTITLWPVPDGNGPYVMNYYTVRQTQDAVLAGGKTVEIPYIWLDAFAAAMAWRLSEKYAPQLEQRMQQKSERAWNIAATQNVENVPLYITPGISSYYDK
jgi:hypothetical protein